jgi:5-(carboxyamino)imidazole ribonucleotide mutase
MARVAIILGSKSDEPLLEKAKPIAEFFLLDYAVEILSAHRSHKKLEKRIEEMEKEGTEVFIGIAGLSAALPGVIASLTVKPVIGVPVSGKVSLDAILSMVQMPGGVPVAVVGLDRSDNGMILACEILALKDEKLREKLIEYKRSIE